MIFQDQRARPRDRPNSKRLFLISRNSQWGFTSKVTYVIEVFYNCFRLELNFTNSLRKVKINCKGQRQAITYNNGSCHTKPK